jgi:hypothetical protein
MKKEGLKDKIKKISENKKGLAMVLSMIFFLWFIFLLIDFYFVLLPSRKPVDSIFSVLPVPIFKVEDGPAVTSKKLIKNVSAVRTFYESQDFASMGLRVDFGTEEGKLRLKIKEREVLDKLVENAIIWKIAQEKGISVSKSDSERELLSKISEAGLKPAEFALNVKKMYGWSLEDFREEIVHPQIYMDRLFEYYKNNLGKEVAAYRKIKEAEATLTDDNSNFQEVAKNYSEGESAKNGGDLGWFKKDQLVPEVAEAAFKIEKGERSGIITSTLGFHIILLEDKKTGQDGQGEQLEEVKLKQIFTRDGGFVEWLTNKKKEADVSILMRDYVWNKDEGRVDFKSQELSRAEEKMKSESDGDPSL